MEQKTAKSLQSAEVIAQLFGITPRYVRMLTQDGILRAEKVKNRNMYDILPTVQGYIKYLTEKAEKKAGKSQEIAEYEAQKHQSEASLKQTKAKLAEYELRDLEAKMIPAEDVKAGTEDLILAIREKVETLPELLVEDVMKAATAAEASTVIRSGCFKILNELAAYEYDPEEHKRRIRAREAKKTE